MDTLRGKISFFIFGVLSVVAVLLLSGAKGMDSAEKNDGNAIGRYQMEIVMRDRSTQIYVMDTTSGAVKWVDDMNKPFAKLKGD
jgi:hypothetical protein